MRTAGSGTRTPSGRTTPISALFRFGFEAGFVIDGIEEPEFAGDGPLAGVRWHDMPDIPPIMVVRMKLIASGR